MQKRVRRYFFDFINGQEKWLNDMAKRGYRLKGCGMLTYDFESCQPNAFEYAVIFAGNLTNARAKDYQAYIETMGFRTFTKNIGLKYAFGKVKWRPYGKGFGQIATAPGNYNNELLILEKEQDGQPFELHTDAADQYESVKAVAMVYGWEVMMTAVLFALTFLPAAVNSTIALIWGIRGLLLILGILFGRPMVKSVREAKHLKDESRLYE
ncbi:DUF2812 domain-containing protein [Fusibacter paucivorans]|uniref:DUF2812 domain-containing protein n=1 Tax=Fusibacter paucivorans TaxID=76009 RepID=A0ABS5PJB1_9FIRM|nr:DUF2812 domain-containing protein [Fusibacter paucivorans]MBS7525118.1 DUF2812 domain-containing protein [Fusibacter paucivorans]